MMFTSMIRYNLYNIVRRRQPASQSAFLPLYQSRVFNGLDLNDSIKNSQSAQRYKQILPYLLMAQTNAFPPKILITQLHFNPEADVLKVVSLRHRGLVSQEFSINNIIPITYADMRGFGRLPEPDLPTYIDDTMTYFNLFNSDTYIFEQDGQWNEENVKHEKLSLDARLNEKDWFDRKNAFL